MKDMNEEKSSSRMIQNVLTQGEKLFSQLVAEAETVKVMGTGDPDARIRRNELLLKIEDQIIEVNHTLGNVDILQKQLKKHLEKLKQLRKILSK